jgi:hypothetical protein
MQETGKLALSELLLARDEEESKKAIPLAEAQ